VIIDFHAHLFPKAIRESREDYFQDPCFRLLYDHSKAPMAGVDALLDSMNAHGVNRSVVFGFPWQDSGILSMHNDYIIETVQKYPDRLTGFCCLNPRRPDAVNEACRCLDAGLSGIGELAFYDSGLDVPVLTCLAPLMELCRLRNLPVLIHTNEPVGRNYPGKAPMTLAQIYSLVKRFADNTLILAHWGGGLLFYHLLKSEAKSALKNVFFDTAASPYLYDPAIFSAAASIAGSEKILFGSDFPLISPEKYFSQIQQSGLSSMEQARILGLNAARLLKL
jgi:predicted TIM-barrel fold metal-dependent hydrolase